MATCSLGTSATTCRATRSRADPTYSLSLPQAELTKAGLWWCEDAMGVRSYEGAEMAVKMRFKCTEHAGVTLLGEPSWWPGERDATHYEPDLSNMYCPKDVDSELGCNQSFAYEIEVTYE